MNYKPQAGSVAFKTIEYLTTNPEEELTSEDIGIKFDKPSKQVHSLLAEAVKAGALKREENAEQELVYRLGSGVPGIVPAAGRNATLRTNLSFAAAPPAKRSPLQIDVAAIQIETGIPVPSGRLPRVDWPALFARMKAGESCLLPLQAKATLAAAMCEFKKTGKGEFSLRRSDTQLRLWRIK
jgi:hypothetical protein